MAWKLAHDERFKRDMGAWIKSIIGSGRAGPGGAAVARDEEGRALSEAETLEIAAGQYTNWCPDRVMEAPTHLEWYDEVLGAQVWADGSISLYMGHL